jgi:hypothetical protein
MPILLFQHNLEDGQLSGDGEASIVISKPCIHVQSTRPRRTAAGVETLMAEGPVIILSDPSQLQLRLWLAFHANNVQRQIPVVH